MQSIADHCASLTPRVCAALLLPSFCAGEIQALQKQQQQKKQQQKQNEQIKVAAPAPAPAPASTPSVRVTVAARAPVHPPAPK